jgi:signal transduction histidine kinase
MEAGGVLPGQDPPVRAEIVHSSERTRVTRVFLPGLTVIRKEPLGPDAERRLRHEVAMLERLRGVAGVAQLAGAPRYPGSIVVADAGSASLAGLAKPLAAGDLITLAVELLRAVAGMHRQGVMHRDITPANVVISGGGAPCLVDFALATSFTEIRPEFTHHTQIVGTLAYLAPEQTGRTGRPVDQRADLYALGATLYELATGEPPFGSGDPLRLIHDHLARAPVPPAQVNPAVPVALSEIIIHLLEKEPDNRYQSADGVVHDLERLRDARSRPGAAALRVGEHDFPLRLLPPSRLVGRDTEVAALQTAFEDALAGQCRGVLVSGAPGVGKTALVDELRPVVTGSDGWFVAGKFDQYRRDLEFDAAHQAFRMLGRLLLAEPEDELAAVRERILAAVGSNAGLLTAMLPEFAALLAVPPDPGDPLTAQVRAQRASAQVLRAVASRKRPVVLFLDDLEWAGRPPLGFVDLVLSEERIDGLLLVGAYRGETVDAAHPLAMPLSRWSDQAGVRHLRLANLPASGSVTMVAEMLRLDPAAAAGLAQMIEPHTHGNPYETVELLNTLRRDSVLTAAAAGWRWDEAAVHAYTGQSEMAGLLAARVHDLPSRSRALVEAMACLGGRAELSLLQTVNAEPLSTVEQILVPALDEGLLVVEPGVHPAVRFRHDRIREVILGGLDPQRRGILQLAMARRLAVVPELFAVAAEQYLPVAEAVDDAAERQMVVGLLRRTADQASLIGDHALVSALLAAALRLIDPRETAVLVEVHTRRHAALYSLGRLEEADDEYRTIEGLSATAAQRAGATAVQVRSLTLRNRFTEAIALGIESLRELGIGVPDGNRFPAELDHQFGYLYWWLDHTEAADDLARPDITDPSLLAATGLINTVLPAVYFTADHAALAWLSLEALRIWIEHGPARTLLGPAGHAAISVVALRDDYTAAYRAVRRILSLSEARGYEPGTSHARYLFSTLCFWFEPIENSVHECQRAREGLIAGGDLANAGYSTYHPTVEGLLEYAPSLDLWVAEVEAGLAFVRRTGNEEASQWLDSYRWLAGVLRGEGVAAAGEPVPTDRYADNPLALLHVHVARAFIAAVFGDPTALARHTAAAMPLLSAAAGLYVIAVAHLLRGLGLAGQARTTDGDERGALLSELDDVTRWLAARAADAPANFLHLLQLVEAERAWAMGDFRAAVLAFDAALREVAQRQRPWHRALVAECAARFYLSHGAEHVGYDHLAQARQEYLAWGAAAKVGQLDWAYPALRPQTDQADEHSGDRPGDSSHRRFAVTTGTIDLLGILSASQALSSETSIERLHARVVQVLSGMTGATGVHLVLWSEDRDGWLLPTLGEGTARVGEADHEREIPMSVLRYAQRVREPLVVGDATGDDRFARDPYFADVTCCSLLALPILSRGMLRALLLLENRLIRGAFSADRLDSVTLIAGQLAVSLDNAQLYAEFRRVGDEQAALRRVATLVARGAAPEEVFATVAEEVGALFGGDGTAIARFEPDGGVTVMGGYGFEPFQPGSRREPGSPSIMASVRATGHGVRRDADDPSASLPEATEHVTSAVASPIVVEGRVWGAIAVGSRRERLPQDAEQRLAEFTELVATAIANAESRAEVTSSRARIVAAADQARRRIERDLHDGAQQRLVSLALELRTAKAAVPPELGELGCQLDRAAAEVSGALDDLRELARGIHPPILADGGLRPALNALARRSLIPIDLAIRAEGRLPEHVEVSAYYVVAEALTNAAKHAHASAVHVDVDIDGEVLRVAVRDDGSGGADFTRGTGLVGLKDRVEALGGRVLLDSPRGVGTSLHVELPLTATNEGLTSR